MVRRPILMVALAGMLLMALAGQAFAGGVGVTLDEKPSAEQPGQPFEVSFMIISAHNGEAITGQSPVVQAINPQTKEVVRQVGRPDGAAGHNVATQRRSRHRRAEPDRLPQQPGILAALAVVFGHSMGAITAAALAILADRALLGQSGVFNQYPWREALRGIQCPGLLITGDPARGAITAPEAAREALALWKNGQVATIPGTGHCIHRDRYEETMATITAFLDAQNA